MPLPWELPAWNAESCIASHGSSCARPMGRRGGGNRQYSGGTRLCQGMAGLHIQQSGRCHGKAAEGSWRVLEPHLGGANLSLGISGPHKAKASPHCGVRQNGGGSLLCAGDCPGAGPKVTAIFFLPYSNQTYAQATAPASPPPNRWVPAGVGQLGGSQLSVGTPKHGWASEMQCLRLVGLHPPRGELGLHWVADDKHPPGEGSQHFEPWQ